MVKKTLIIILLLTICGEGKSQQMDFIDSLLSVIDQLIRDDLLKDSIYVSERSWLGFGESNILEVVFSPKNSGILTMFNVSESMKKKYYDQVLNPRLVPFRKYINKHQALPHGTFEHLIYKFLLLAIKEETFGDALCGEYKFEVTKKGISIIDKKVEILRGENAIIKKYNSTF